MAHSLQLELLSSYSEKQIIIQTSTCKDQTGVIEQPKKQVHSAIKFLYLPRPRDQTEEKNHETQAIINVGVLHLYFN